MSIQLEILIPTYNRDSFLRKNLFLISEEIMRYQLQDDVAIIVSDNASTDHTYSYVQEVKNTFTQIKLMLFVQEDNVGLEKNACFLLSKAKADYIMYLGDDDYLPSCYLTKILSIIIDKNIGCIIPGIMALHPDGHVVPYRYDKFSERLYQPGYQSVLRLAQYGHQLSGLVLRLEGLSDAYLSVDKFRNIYPFIFFVGYNCKKFTSIYVPSMKILVSTSNKKDWGYDRAGLLPDILRNFKLLYPKEILKRFWLNNTFMIQQRWRLRVSRNLKVAFDAFIYLMKSKDVDILTKLFLPLTYCFAYLKLFVCKALFRVCQ